MMHFQPVLITRSRLRGDTVNVPRHPSIRSTLSSTKPTVSPNTPRGSQLPSTGTRVHSDLFADDEAIGYELADCLTRIGVGDFINFVRVEPDLALAAARDGGGEPLLSA